jgi:phosphoribosylformylglycinamidine cyclo-ligase
MVDSVDSSRPSLSYRDAGVDIEAGNHLLTVLNPMPLRRNVPV